MTYDPTIPKPADFLSVSQAQIQTNFDQANTIFGQDHVEFSVSSDGNHKQVTLLPTANYSGPPTTNPGQGRMFMDVNADDTNTNYEPYWRHDANNTTNYPMAPIVAYGVGSISTPGGGGTLQVQQQFGCTITRNTDGIYDVALSPTLTLTAQTGAVPINTGCYYAVIGTTLWTTTSHPRLFVVTAQTPTSFQFNTIRSDDGGIADSDGFYFIVIQF